ncbi:ankyrin and het domain-containing protein [Diplodia corticola]|uniref:Ankyrin and het domain-containing protein n=1 Tax=Diplodia corticola TaxID=236234 RepID=A0A1J9S094_9PEZI|nr:ankyrin and het domain-containing protein [Diplodia corticola]OJD33101.1 ankyrin and het domain-containing protein [Diplodia corticola]
MTLQSDTNIGSDQQWENDFRYRPLRTDKHEIRLIHVQAQPRIDDFVRCTLRHAVIDELPEYTALSYVWGDRNTTARIILDEHEFQVTANLESALRHLAMDCNTNGEAEIAMWVDAVCIDQSNVSERTHQVSQIDKVYKEASQTIVWLGPSSDDSSLALDSLRKMSRTVQQKLFGQIKSWSHFRFNKSPLPGSRGFVVQRALDAILKDLCDRNFRVFNALASLFDRAWFRRVWVIQERVLSIDPVLVCGDDFITWHQFYMGFWVLCGARDYLNMVNDAALAECPSLASLLTSKLMNVTPVAYAAADQPLINLLTVLYGNSNEVRLQASDERDYIFSLLGLVDAHYSPEIRADYSRDWNTVRTEHFICTGNVTSALGAFLGTGLRKENASAAAKWTDQALYDESFDSQNHLHLSAVYVDSISKPGQILLEPCDILNWLRGLRHLLGHGGEAYNTEEAVSEALWRTPIADRALMHNYETARASEHTRQSYLALLSGTVSPGVQYADIVRDKLHGRRPFRTARGFLGIGPEHLSEQDSIWILPGAHVPLVLRDVGQAQWLVVGEAYVHGIMDGEALEKTPEFQNIELV